MAGTQLQLNTTSYEFDYFSGSAIGVYIGDILVDDIATIQFTVQQQKRPIYGYASQYFHTVASGQVLVSGSFTIPFKEADYLLLALQRYSTMIGDSRSPISGAKGKGYEVKRQNIERIIKDESKVDKNQMYQDLSALRDEAFENIAETFEDMLWQPKTLNSEFTEPNVSGTITQDSYHKYRRADQYPPFNIFILYGDISNAAANHTTGQGQLIAVGGEPILEQYEFIARNLG